ncbi:MAG: DUF177 domain-containing protein [Alistipes sp.]|nr:DUF177 domain-containing protein [Alistipes sp.]
MEVKAGYIIDCRGLKNGSYDYRFKVGGELFELERNDDIRGGEFDVRVEMRKSGSFAELEVAVEGYASVECDRCLEECRLPVSSSAQLTVRFADGEPQYDGEVMQVSAAEPQIDLTHYIYETIVLALPYRRVHPDGECNPEMVARIAGVDAGDDPIADEE